ncbi:hypothetical protein GCM10009616_37500 [Microlunatus lacustris]
MGDLRPWTWGWLVACTLAKGVLAATICLALWGAVPVAIGWLPTTVSSGSMLPRLHVGDVAVSRPLDGAAPTLDSVLLFQDPDRPDRLRMHRFVRVGEDGLLVTRGDANPAEDSSPITVDAVLGVGTLRVPWVALPVVWLRERAWVPLGLSMVVLVGLTLVAGQSRRFGFPDPAPTDGGDGDGDGNQGDEPADGGASRPGADCAGATAVATPGTSRTGGVVALGAAAGVALLAAVCALPAGAAFSSTTKSGVGAAAASYFRCSGAVTAASPSLWFRMDETSSSTTTALDSSGNARHGIYGATGKTLSAERGCTSDSGRSMEFDGSSGYLSSAQIVGTTPQTFTLAVWFKTTTGRGGKLVGFGNVRTGPSVVFDRHLYLTTSGRVVVGVYLNGARTVSSPASYNDGRWHQAVATVSSSGMRLYLDGAPVAVDASVTGAEPTSGSYLRVGYDNLDNWPSVPTSRFFAGSLDEVALYLTALTPAQIAAQYGARG